MTRKKATTKDEVEVLLTSRRRCALCFGLRGDLGIKDGQVAHLDRDPSNNSPENLCFLCLVDHETYDRRSRQAKGFTPQELAAYRDALYASLATHPELLWMSGTASPHVRRKAKERWDAALYERQLVIYRATRDFMAAVVREGKVKFEDLSRFASATDEVVFLFDDDMSNYLSELYRKGVRLEYVNKRLERGDAAPDRPALIEEEGQLLTWFTEQFSVLLRKAVPFMRP
jgi:hypothetical protein